MEIVVNWGKATLKARAPWGVRRAKELAYYRTLLHPKVRGLPRRRALGAGLGFGRPVHFWPSVPSHHQTIFPRMAVRLGFRPTLAPPQRDRPSVLWLDRTFVDAALLEPIDNPRRVINYFCRDISKRTLDQHHYAVFGYGLAVDPRTTEPPFVQKNDLNAWHDGRIVTGPVDPKPEFVYQRVVDNRCGSGLVEDIRVPFFGGNIPFVYIKRRSIESRFVNGSNTVWLEATADALTSAECAQIRALCRSMALDYGEMDVLRDRGEGRIYVVDVNKTPFGPPNELPAPQADEAMARYAEGVEALLLARSTR